jgi:hypothetical protein
MKQFNFEVSIKFQSFIVISLIAYLGHLGSFSSLFIIFYLPKFLFILQFLVSAAILRCQNNFSSAQC